jgi:hypothetical protein
MGDARAAHAFDGAQQVFRQSQRSVLLRLVIKLGDVDRPSFSGDLPFPVASTEAYSLYHRRPWWREVQQGNLIPNCCDG